MRVLQCSNSHCIIVPIEKQKNQENDFQTTDINLTEPEKVTYKKMCRD